MAQICKTLVTGQVLLYDKDFSHLNYLFKFWGTAIIHQQFVAMIRGHMRFVLPGDSRSWESPKEADIV